MTPEDWEARDAAQAALEEAAHEEYVRKVKAKLLGGEKAFRHFTVENYKKSGRTAEVYAACASFDSSRDNLYICGPTGSGKSHLAAIAARRSLDKRNWQGAVETIKPMDLSRRLRGCADAIAEADVIADLVKREVLVIDDLGVAKDTEFLLSAVYEVIDGRYQAARGGLIITSNLTLDDLAQKFGDDRVSSRLIEIARVFNLKGVHDHRVPEKKS